MMIVYFILSGLLSALCTPVVRALMVRLGITDRPKKGGRKIHSTPIPLGGGMAIFFSVAIVTGLAYWLGGIGQFVSARTLAGILVGGLVLMLGGIIDDRYTLKARYQIWFPIIAALSIVITGSGAAVITNPFGGSLSLHYPVVSFFGFDQIFFWADVVTFFWLMGMMFTTKFLDGLDGLVTGIAAIGALVIFFLTRQTLHFQPDVSTISLIFFGSCLGFLIWNWHPAKIFLGEGGSLFTGYMIGVLAILSGGKIATTLLIVGVPMLDVVRVIIRRMQKNKPVFEGDKEHLHYKLLESGLSQKQAVLLLYSISFLFGMATLFLQSGGQMVALVFLFVLMMLIGVWFSKKDKETNYANYSSVEIQK